MYPGHELAFLFFSPVWAPSPATPFQHEGDGRWEDIVKTELRANAGELEAQFRLGVRHDFAEGARGICFSNLFISN